MSSVSFVLYIVTNRHWRSQNKPQGKKLGGGAGSSRRGIHLHHDHCSHPHPHHCLYRFVEMNGSKVTSVVIYKASCHKIVNF